MLLYGAENEFFLKHKAANHEDETIKYYKDGELKDTSMDVYTVLLLTQVDG